MFGILFSDPLMEEMLFDTPCCRRFAGIEMVEDRIPDATRFLNHSFEEGFAYRHLLE